MKKTHLITSIYVVNNSKKNYRELFNYKNKKEWNKQVKIKIKLKEEEV